MLSRRERDVTLAAARDQPVNLVEPPPKKAALETIVWDAKENHVNSATASQVRKVPVVPTATLRSTLGPSWAPLGAENHHHASSRPESRSPSETMEAVSDMDEQYLRCSQASDSPLFLSPRTAVTPPPANASDCESDVEVVHAVQSAYPFSASPSCSPAPNKPLHAYRKDVLNPLACLMIPNDVLAPPVPDPSPRK